MVEDAGYAGRALRIPACAGMRAVRAKLLPIPALQGAGSCLAAVNDRRNRNRGEQPGSV
jgi:hypothetical protein